MLAGCLPALLQLPFFSVVYRLFLSGTIGGQHERLLSHDLFGVLARQPLAQRTGPVERAGAVFGAVRAAGRGRLACRAAPAGRARPSPEAATGAGPPAGVAGLLIRVLPYATVAVAAVLPLAAASTC